MSSNFDLYQVAQNYLSRILSVSSDKTEDNQLAKNDNDSDHIKILLLDDVTSKVISMVSTQSELLKHEIFLIDRLENTERDNLKNLPCICLLRPSDLTVSNLCNEISSPKYKSYQVYFNNVVSKPRLERLAESDDMEIVSKVSEIFQDFFTINRAFFTSINIQNALGMNVLDTWDDPSFDSSLESVVSLLLSLKLNPVVRYESNSKMCHKLASSVLYKIKENKGLFSDVPKKDISPLLLIVDRRNDPITPLLFPWTYQSMIHEVFGIRSNTVDMSELSNVSEELKTVVLNETQDKFYENSMFSNFGELSHSLKDYINKYKQKTKTNSSISTIKDMKFFLENYPEFRKISLNLSKHMLLSSNIDKKINEWRMWEVSEFEQTLVSDSSFGNHSEELSELKDFLFDRKKNEQGQLQLPLSEITKAKLLALYALKYETFSDNQTSSLIRMLKKQKFSPEYLHFVPSLLKYAGSSRRLSDNVGSIFDRVAKSSTTFINGLNFGRHGDSSNVYMQHIPRLQNVLMKIAKCSLDNSLYPYIKGHSSVNETTGTGDHVPPQEIVIFVVGGVTFEEARLVAQLNSSNSGLRCVIGGTNIPNTNDFMNNIIDVGSTWGAGGAI